MRKLAVVIISLALTGCATGYKPDGPLGGYSETQLDTNSFKVDYHGNAYTSRERAQDYVLLRSAEVTLENGFSHFVIADSRQEEEISTYNEPVTTSTRQKTKVKGNTMRVRSETFTSGGGVKVQRHPRMSNTIVCFKGRPTKTAQFDGALVHDARMISTALRKEHEIKD